MKENKYEELMYLSVIGEICKAPEGDENDFICFKPSENFSSNKALYLSKITDEKDCIIISRLNNFERKMGLEKISASDCGMNRMKNVISSYLADDEELGEEVCKNSAKNLESLKERKVLSEEQVSAMNSKLESLVNNLQSTNDEEFEINL